MQSGPYFSDANYELDLGRYVAYICQQTGCPNLAAFLRAQSREETGYGRLFTSINNFANMGAADADPKAAPGYPTPEAGGQGWLDFLGWGNPNSTYAPFVAAAQAGEGSVLTLAQLIQQGGWATDSTYALDVADKA